MEKITLFFVTTSLLFVQTAHAYIGPGAGLGAIAVTIALVIGILLLILGVVWFPLKRFLKSRSKQKDTSSQSDTNS